LDELTLTPGERALKGASTTFPVRFPSARAGNYSGRTMKPELPPPDPHESLGHAPDCGTIVPEPMAVYMRGRPAPENDRVTDAILDLRPGLLIVCSAS
jgi:hypothetical protein